MSDVFGTGGSKFVNSTTAVTLNLPNVVLNPQWVVSDFINRISLTGEKDIIFNGSYSNFTMIIRIHKQASIAARQQLAKDILAQNGQKGQFFPYLLDASGTPVSNPVKDNTSTPVDFFMTIVNTGFADDLNDLDQWVLSFEATNYTDPSKSIV